MSHYQADEYALFEQNVYSLYINNESTKLAPSQIKYEGTMKDSLLFLNIRLTFINDKDIAGNDNAVLLLPINNFQMLCQITCSIDNKEIALDIKEIRGEQEKKIAEMGQNVITLGYQFFRINIGTLLKNSKCDLSIKMNIISTNINEKTYKTVIPHSSLNPLKPDNFSFNIKYDDKMSIKDTILGGNETAVQNIKFSFDNENNNLSIFQKPSIPIVLETELFNEIPNVVHSGMNDEYFIISILPDFSKEVPKNDFIFIADCSGSMSGERVRNVSNCLLNFLPSLPKDCKFNIIRFGSGFECIFDGGKLVDYNEQNLEKAKEKVKNMQADLGGTNLYGPLVEAYRQSEDSKAKGKIVQIFTLTDGQIGDRDRVFNLVGQHKKTHHINSIGVGSSFDNDLVKGLASQSEGNYQFVSNVNDTRDVVLDLLNKTQNPKISKPSIKINGGSILNATFNESISNCQMLNILIKKTDANSHNITLKDVEITGIVENREVKNCLNLNKPRQRQTSNSNQHQNIGPYSNLNQHQNTRPNSGSRSSPHSEQDLPVSIKTLEKTLDGLINSQSFDGKWSVSYTKSLTEFLKDSYNYNTNFESKLNIIKKKSIDLCQSNNETEKGDIQSTLIALSIFNVQFKNKKTYWELIEKKALDWLESHNIEKTNANYLISLFCTKNDCTNIMKKMNQNEKKSQYGEDDFLEYDYDYYESYQYTMLYVECKVGEMYDRQLRNAFSKYATIVSCNVQSLDKKKSVGLITVSSGSEAKECIKRSVLMRINENPISVSFQDENIRNRGYRRNYKLMVNKKVKKSCQIYGNLINILSFISPYQARALLHDRNLFNEWINLHFIDI